MLSDDEILAAAAQMRWDMETFLIWGTPAFRRYCASFHHRDRPRHAGKIRGKKRKLSMRDLSRGWKPVHMKGLKIEGLTGIP